MTPESTTSTAAFPDLLFLAHRIPYPPNKGDKIRSYNVLKYLAARFRVHLGAFVDDPNDWQYVDEVRKLCASVHLVKLNPKIALARSATGLLTGEALGLPYYRDGSLKRWIAELKTRVRLSGIYVYSSTIAQYIEEPACPSVLDLCDVDSEKWRQYSERRGFPMNLVYKREARLLASSERLFSERFDSVVLVSDSECDLFRKVAPSASARTHTLRNGVDTVFFDPALTFQSPFSPTEEAVVFTGAMDYWANVDAVRWFAEETLPLIRKSRPNAKFYIVGSRPSDAVRSLASTDVIVTGTVPDVRPYLGHARVVVAPLRIARGIQNKVLEALSMARPVVATDDALDGLAGVGESGAATANDPARFADAVVERLAKFTVESRARRYVQDKFGWEASLSLLDRLLGRRQ